MNYKDFNVNTPEAERRKFDVGDIYLNSAKCLKCGEVLISKHRHDFVTCSCGGLSVDGGSWYAKRNFMKIEDFEELSVLFKDAETKYEQKKK